MLLRALAWSALSKFSNWWGEVVFQVILARILNQNALGECLSVLPPSGLALAPQFLESKFTNTNASAAKKCESTFKNSWFWLEINNWRTRNTSVILKKHLFTKPTCWTESCKLSILFRSIKKETLVKIIFLLKKNYEIIHLEKTLKVVSSKLFFHLKLLGTNEKTQYSLERKYRFGW